MTGVRGTGAQAVQWLGMLVLAAVTVVLCYLALTKDTAADSDVVRDDPSASLSETPAATDQPSDQPSSDEAVKAPRVPDQRFADFTQGDDLPDGSVTYDSPSNASGMRVTPKGLTHGSVEDGEADGLGLVETELDSDVRSLGFRVRFPEGESGSAVLVAWESSAVVALEADDSQPSGMRFVATPGAWTLSILSKGGEEVLTEGTFAAGTGPAEFRVVRDDDQIFVVDPSGLVTSTTKPRVGELIGPFASWGLIERSPELTPAVIESVWAG